MQVSTPFVKADSDDDDDSDGEVFVDGASSRMLPIESILNTFLDPVEEEEDDDFLGCNLEAVDDTWFDCGHDSMINIQSIMQRLVESLKN